jgi:lipoprotein-releasing system ATP-binding protein
MNRLESKNVIRSFRTGDRTIDVLKGVTLGFLPGETVAVMGPSGAGKSTFLYMLGLIDSPTSGEILFQGKRIDNMSSRQKAHFRNRHIGFIFQSFYLLPELNCLQNVSLPAFIKDKKNFWEREEIYKKARIMLDKVGLGHRLLHKPNELSGGEMQRVAICRSLINEPEIILADEPTGNLDSENAKIVSGVLFSLCREMKKILVLATHNENLALRADKIVKLVDGHVVK